MPKHNQKSADAHRNNQTSMSLSAPHFGCAELAEKHGEEIPTELHHARKRTAHRALVMATAKLYLAEETRCGQGLGQHVGER